MGAFLTAVQREEVTEPLRRTFKLDNWTKAFKELSDDQEDQDLYKAGCLVHSKAAAIRKALRVTMAKELNYTTKIRTFLAITNHDFWALKEKIHKQFEEVGSNGSEVLVTDLVSIKIPLAIGENFSPDEIVTSIVDGAQVSIGVILNNGGPFSGQVKLADLDWNGFQIDFNLGGLYTALEGLWDDCVWNGYRIVETEEGMVFKPIDLFWVRLRAASRGRYDNLNLQFLGYAKEHAKHVDLDIMHARMGIRDVMDVTKVERKQIIKLCSVGAPTENGKELIASAALARELYYAEIFGEKRDLLAGSTLRDVLNAWTVVVRCANIIASQIKHDGVLGNDEPSTWLPRHAPILQTRPLMRAISDGTNVSFEQAKAILKFLTFRGETGQELWAQPLVPVNEENLAPMFAATEGPNLRRIVDIWIRQLGVDMGIRGKAFEKHIRGAIKDDIKDSALLSSSVVLDHDFVLRPPEDRPEEIDLVIVIGNLVILGEAKCAVTPTEAKQYARHRQIITDAVAQIRRKADSVQRHKKLFAEKMMALGIQLNEEFTILPMVVMNNAMHVGMPVDGVPIVDEYIFNVFFSGEMVDLADIQKSGDEMKVAKRIIYKTAVEATEVAGVFFNAPLQMEVFVAGLHERRSRFWSVGEGDWDATIFSYDCVPDGRMFLTQTAK
ncbi:MAG: hypothetical protein Q7T20_09465 [Saprospiraceae bacterium]|nr:hypothetical protein [Saprospiraceae bacterium]